MKKKILIGIVLLLTFIFFAWQGRGLFPNKKAETASVSVNKKVLPEKISYSGVNGKDALWVLSEKENATVFKDASGLVVSINGREASSSKHEYWAFYVNGKLAPVGPAEYTTNNADLIEWKIETY
jgi:hypothetical protein